VAVVSRATAVIPRADNQHVEDTGVLFFNRFVGSERTEKVFVVVPNADAHSLFVFVRDLLQTSGIQKVIVSILRVTALPRLYVIGRCGRNRSLLTESCEK